MGYSPGMTGVTVSRFSVGFSSVLGAGSESIFFRFSIDFSGFPPVLVWGDKSILVGRALFLCF